MQDLLAKIRPRLNIDTLMMSLVILFPVLSLSVRHWLSGIYSLLCVISIFLLRRQKMIDKRDSILIGFVVAYLTVFFISGTINGWTPTSVHSIGAQLKFLLFIPLYIYLRNNFIPIYLFYYAIAISGIVLGIQSLADIYLLDRLSGWGIYGHIIIGDYSALISSFCLILLFEKKDSSQLFRVLCVSGLVLSVFAAVISSSRNAWLALLVLYVVLSFIILLRNSSKLLVLKVLAGFVLLFLVATLITPESILERKDRAFEEYSSYLQGEKIERHSSIGYRLEQWKAALHAYLKKPVLGHGPGNTGIAVNEIVDEGKADRVIYKENAKVNIVHVHNGYLEMLVAQGTVGFLVLIGFFVYLYWFFIVNWNVDIVISLLGLTHITGFLIFFLTEIPFIHDNFISIFLLFLGIFYSEIQKREGMTRPV